MPWLVASLLAHAWWLGPAPRSWQAGTPTKVAVSLQWRLQSVPALPSVSSESPGPEAVRVEPAPRAAPRRARPPQPGAPALTEPPPSPPNQSEPQAQPQSLATAAQLPAAGRWRYRLTWQGETGEAWIDWQPQGDHYRLSLQRSTTARALPEWQTQGRITAQGLQPETFSSRSAKGRQNAQLHFDGQAGVLVDGRGERHPLPEGTQDRLSWIWQAAALAASAAQPLRDGDTLQLWVSAWRGPPQAWTLRAERDEEMPGWLRLRRQLPEGALLEQLLWLDPARGFLPVRLRVRFDDSERWELALDMPPSAPLPTPASP